ncbi:MAG: 4'-phosphopantetheinyl transferase superfamily protein, partial [Phycisphaerales bacterium JB064]
LLRVWTRKEALAKAMGVGLPDDVRSLRVPREVLGIGRWRRMDGWLWVGCPCEDGCVASLVVRSEQPDDEGAFDYLEPGLSEDDAKAWSLMLPI